MVEQDDGHEEKPKTCLTDGSPVTPDHKEIDPKTGQQKGYVVLCPEERAKGFVRPLRTRYKHIGIRPKHPIRDLTEEERERYKDQGYVAYEEYPEGEALAGRFWTRAQLESGCGGETTMGLALSETYARKPDFYSGTFCAVCRDHFQVGPYGEFVWIDKEGNVTDERVGT